jgi:hypothetical protein
VSGSEHEPVHWLKGDESDLVFEPGASELEHLFEQEAHHQHRRPDVEGGVAQHKPAAATSDAGLFFEDRNVKTVASEQHRHAQAARPGTHHRHPFPRTHRLL